MAAHYLAGKPNPAVRAFVAVGMPGQQSNIEQMNNIKSLEKITLPMLDIYGSDDLENIRTTKAQRASAAKRAGNSAYTQVEVPGANHFFNNQGDALVKRVRGWLEKHAAGTEVKK
jgi:pimeloyl-ACP methyl ester carboxylesterase